MMKLFHFRSRRQADDSFRNKSERFRTQLRRPLSSVVKEDAFIHVEQKTVKSYTEPSQPTVSETSTLPIRLEPATANRASDPLGLTVLYDPEATPSADIIFVHGLGGSSRLTWCKDRDLNLFWPREWLPVDSNVQHARILSFGYNANFRSSSQSSSLGISDFAKNLLYDMLFGRDSDGNTLRLGEVPIIFVVHSMGGLVFKQAYLDAQLDTRYTSLVNAIKGVVFLSTPHRGSELAKLLNKILSATVGLTPKHYVSELIQNGPFLRMINEQFRHLAPSLQIFSFYETLRTSLGISSSLIVDSESARLGYPGEISRSLNADHHNACKFESPNDPNYRVVLGALKSLMPTGSSPNPQSITQETDALRDILSITTSFENDLDLFSGRRADGTCQWVLDNPSIQEWISSPSSPSLLWLHGRPARGKSILSSYIVQHLHDMGTATQYFFFRAGDEMKRSMASLLKVLAFQAAVQITPFRKALISLTEGGYAPKDVDWKAIWTKLFTNLLFELDSDTTLYWVIDGLDEASSPEHLFELLPDITRSKITIKILIASRWTRDFSTAFERIRPKISSAAFSINDDRTDINIYVKEELKYCSWSDEITSEITNKIIDGADGNFLWVHLMLQEVKDCHTEDDIRERLSELPPGMEGIYKRMEKNICQIRRESDRNLSRKLLTWAIHARRPLTVEELADILEPEFGRLLNIPHTVNQLCGQFVVVEGNEHFGLIHQTAREYLSTTSGLPFSLNAIDAHVDLFTQCMSSFLDKSLRSKLQKTPTKVFLYRATSWAYHLEAAKSSTDVDRQLELLTPFLSNPSVLTWIYVLASLGQLTVLTEASESLYYFVQRIQKLNPASDTSLRCLDESRMLESWSHDILKLLGKFGDCLSQDPASIYTCIPSFCPKSSAIFKNFGEMSSTSLQIHGQPDIWDDCLARVSVGSENVASLICCSGRYLTVVNNVGTAIVWNCTTFHHCATLQHGEGVSSVCFSAKGDRLATYGFRTTKVWILRTGQLEHTILNCEDTRSMCLQFANDDSELIMGAERRCVLKVDLTTDQKLWTLPDAKLLNDVESREGTFLNSPTALSISPDGSKIAATYRRFPLDIWSIDSATILKRIWRLPKPGQVSAPLPFASKISWHPSGDELIGIFLDSSIFRVNLVDGTIQEQPPDLHMVPSDILCSPDGLSYAVCGVRGMVKIYDYQSSTLIYQLSCEDIISAFCFSQDGRRFFDVRGACCTVWEPNALTRLSTMSSAPGSYSSDKDTKNLSITFESFTDNAVPITLMSLAPNGSIAGLADGDGAVMLVNLTTSEKIHVDQTATTLSIEHFVWGDDSIHFCYAEVSGRLTLARFNSTGDSPTPHRLARFKPKFEPGGIDQLILFSNNQSVLLSFQKSVQVWSLDPPKMESIYTYDAPHPPKWIEHPQSPDHFLSVTTSGVDVYKKNGLERLSTWHWGKPAPLTKRHRGISGPTNDSPNEPSSSSPPPASPIVEKVARVHRTFYHAYTIVELCREASGHALRPRFLIFDGAAVDSEPRAAAGELRPVAIPPPVADAIETPLGILANGVFVFLDRSFWICSWHLRSSDVKRHFFVPRDWLPVQSLGLLRITASGSILCARNGGVSAIDTAIGLLW
ncbi:hypothetical protein F4810DRAFT_650319 [Camillea tinctor]|nr:hypothetical protein F4810DRAFT_650319 [Camillea tinctor]